MMMHDSRHLQQLLDSMQSFSAAVGLTISITKTEVMLLVEFYILHLARQILQHSPIQVSPAWAPGVQALDPVPPWAAPGEPRHFPVTASTLMPLERGMPRHHHRF